MTKKSQKTWDEKKSEAEKSNNATVSGNRVIKLEVDMAISEGKGESGDVNVHLEGEMESLIWFVTLKGEALADLPKLESICH